MMRFNRIFTLSLTIPLLITTCSAAQSSTARLLVYKQFASSPRSEAGASLYPPVTSLAPALASYSTVADYLSRVLYEGPAMNLQQLSTDLQDEGYVVDSPTDLEQIYLNGFVYNPFTQTTDSPPAPHGYTPQKADGLFVLALAGYPTPQWLTSLQAANVRLIEALPPSGYLVRVNRVSAAALPKSFPFVKAVFALTPGGKKALLYGATEEVFRRVFIQAVEEQAQDSIEDQLRALSSESVRVVARSAPRVIYTAALSDLDIENLAFYETVYAISGISEPQLSSERQALIATQPIPSGAPGPITLPSPKGTGYTQYLINHGFANGFGATTVALLDTGLDNGIFTGPQAHPAFVSSPIECIPNQGGGDCSDRNLHGTMTASVVAGYPPATNTDAGGYFWGEGLAPTVRLIVDRFINCNSVKTVANALSELAMHTPSQPQVVNFSINNANCDYDSDARLFDQYARTNGWLFTVSAGNVVTGTPCGNTGSPATAKNAIAVGATHNFTLNWPFDTNTHSEICDWCGLPPSQDARNIPSFSPLTKPGNIRKPDLVAPGTRITGPLSRNLMSSWCTNAGRIFCNINLASYLDNQTPQQTYWYGFSGGTSFSAPVVAGAAAVVRQWYTQTLRPGGNPSPALTKAILINGARSVKGGVVQNKTFDPAANISIKHITLDPYQGYGTVSFDRLLKSSAATYYVRDQGDAAPLGPSGSWQQALTIIDGSKEVRITLVWTEQPGNTNSPYVAKNNLDMLAYASPCFPCFEGNKISSSTGYSIAYTAPPAGDSINNVEEIIVPPGYYPSGTLLTLLVQATSLTTNGLDAFGATSPLQQDFAVFASNAH